MITRIGWGRRCWRLAWGLWVVGGAPLWAAVAGNGNSRCPFAISQSALHPLALFQNAEAAAYRVEAKVLEGEVPKALAGSLFRNGPGVFSRGRQIKNSILDADGLVRKFQFADGRVFFDARMIETDKWLAEDRAGRFIYPTWTTLSSNWLRNLGWRITNQAGVHLLSSEDRLFALDEMQVAVEIDPDKLDTLGEYALDADAPRQRYQVHYRIEGETKHLLSYVPGRDAHFMIRTVDKNGEILIKQKLTPPRLAYIHDWAVTARYYVFIFHPVMLNTWRFLTAGLGLNSIAESFDFKPEDGNLVWVVPKNDPKAARTFMAGGAQIWHILNAYDSDHGPVIDFSANHLVEAFSGKGSRFGALARGENAVPTVASSFIRRYEVEWESGRLRERVVAGDANYDFPAIHPSYFSHHHRYGFFARQEAGTAFFQGVTRVDYALGVLDHFKFQPHEFSMEPVFVPHPTSTAEDAGWVLVEVYDLRANVTKLAIFNANSLGNGPVAWIGLPWPLPVSFHGIWVGGGGDSTSVSLGGPSPVSPF